MDVEHRHYHYNDWYYPLNPCRPWRNANVYRAFDSYAAPIYGTSDKATTSFCSTNVLSESLRCAEPQIQNDEGITVKGSQTVQDFTSVSMNEMETNTNVIIIRLHGIKSTGEIIKQPVTVKTKLCCETCGKMRSSSDKFCSRCGTALV